jgi:hypothetical protein
VPRDADDELMSYHVESAGLPDLKAHGASDAQSKARLRLEQGHSSVIVKSEFDEERVVGLYGIKLDGVQVELNGWIYEGTFRVTLEQRIEKMLPLLAYCPPRLRRDYPAQAPFTAVKVGRRQRPSALAATSTTAR